MELAKIRPQGHIVIPPTIRKKLALREGDKIIFLEENGRIMIENSAMRAFELAQAAFAGEAERLDIHTEADVVAMVKEVRAQRWEEKHAHHA